MFGSRRFTFEKFLNINSRQVIFLKEWNGALPVPIEEKVTDLFSKKYICHPVIFNLLAPTPL